MNIATEVMKVPYRDLAVREAGLKTELLAAVDKVLSHGRILLGPEVDEFEEKIASCCQRRYAVGVGSGTDALYLALRSVGVGHGDEVITTPMSWIATANAITMCRARPVFVDIGDDLNIDADLIEAAITPRTKVIMPVHFTGKVCQIEKIVEIAAEHGVMVIEDAAQAFGAASNGMPAGSFGQISCFSMNPMKVFAGYGEAGVVVTDYLEVAEKVQSLRYAGTVNKEDCFWPSLNSRLDTIQAAMLLVSLKHLGKRIEKRRKIAKFYNEALAGTVGCPIEDEDDYHIYYTYTILAARRDELQEYLAGQGIETKIHHRLLMPQHTGYVGKSMAKVPNAERLVKQILSIPNQEDLTGEQLEYIADGIREFYEG